MSKPPPPRSRSASLDQPYLPGDEIPAPEANEVDTDTTWALFSSLSESQDAALSASADVSPAPAAAKAAATATAMPQTSGDPRYAKTEPSGLDADPESAREAAPASEVSVGEAMVEARRNNRLCPLHGPWKRLYELLPNKDYGPPGLQPMPPLTASALRTTPSLAKRMRLRDHIEWADAHGGLAAVYALLKSLPEDQWHHMGE